MFDFLGRSGAIRTRDPQSPSLQTAIDLYRLDVGRLPSAEEGLDALVHAPADPGTWLGPYLARNAVPADPWGNPYRYEVEEASAVYRIISYGADRLEGGERRAADLVLSAEDAPAAGESRAARVEEEAP